MARIEPGSTSGVALRRGSSLALGLRITMRNASASRLRPEEVLFNVPGHRLAQRLAGRDIVAEMDPAPDDAVLRLRRGGREAGERMRHTLQILGRQTKADLVGAEEMREDRRGRAADRA